MKSIIKNKEGKVGNKVAVIFQDRIKPNVFRISSLVGFSVIYGGLAFFLNEKWSMDYYLDGSEGPVYYFSALIILGFALDNWSKNTLIENRIERTIDTFDLSEVVSSDGIINYRVLNDIVDKVMTQVWESCREYVSVNAEEGVENKKFKELERKIKECLWKRIGE